MGFLAAPALVLDSPRMEPQPSGWRDLAVELDLPPVAQGGALALAWRSGEGAWRTIDTAQINLPTQGGTYTFHVLISPVDQGSQPPDQLRVSVDGLPGAAVRAVSLHVVP